MPAGVSGLQPTAVAASENVSSPAAVCGTAAAASRVIAASILLRRAASRGLGLQHEQLVPVGRGEAGHGDRERGDEAPPHDPEPSWSIRSRI
jgi:hypothetical protein